MDKNDTQNMIEQLNSAWLSKRYIFPGPQPVSIERKHIVNLKSHDYLVGHKNDGERTALCFIRYDDKPRCFFLNRKLEITYISVLVSKKMYEGTIFDCEMIDNQIYIFDCPLFCGKSLRTENFNNRLSFCESFLTGIKRRPDEKYDFLVKEFVELAKFKNLNHCEKSDGYVFVPVNKPVQTGTHNYYYKWKPRYKNTVDFCINKDGEVFLQNAGKLCKAKVSLNYEYCKFDTIKFIDSVVVLECEYQIENTWKVLHPRCDKTIPNSLYTFKKTILNIEENIDINELIVK
jgi:hypothetical protein